MRKIFLGIAGAIVVAAAIFYFTKGGTDSAESVAVNPAFAEHISSYTTGLLTSGAPLRVIFTRDMVDSASIGKEAAARLFDISPSVKGTTVWLDPHTLAFKPSVRWTFGQHYKVAFELGKLAEVPQELRVFEFGFQVVAQNYEVSVENVRPFQKADLKRQKIEGIVKTADFAENTAVEKALTAKQDGKSLSITWTHAEESTEHAFTIEDVSRKEAASSVSLSLQGATLGVERDDDREVEIPALGDFKITQVRVEQGTTQFVVIQFSDPLNESQNLDGLLTIGGLTNLDFEVNDNEIRAYPPVRQNGSAKLTVEPGISNVLNYKMSVASTFDLTFERILPALRFVGKGTVLPSSEGLVLPFEAVNLKTVDVGITRVFENNVLQFLQVNNLNDNSEMRRVGLPVLKKTVSLENSGVTDLGKWNRFSIDLASLITAQPGAIYQVNISFRRSYLAFACDGDNAETAAADESWDDDMEDSNWDSYEGYYDEEYYDYDWEQRDNPCDKAYYRGSRNIERNVIASDLGLLAKRGGDGQTWIVVNDLKSTKPLGGVQVELYDFQQQLLGSASTDSDGKAIIASPRNPFVVVAHHGGQLGYLKIPSGDPLSLSNFQVGGDRINKGLKGFLYGERGVWRPGDSLYLHFILEDRNKLLPPSHPVVFELENPQGQVTSRLVRSGSENGFYKFGTVTASDAPTGNWLGRVKVGGTEFTQPLKIEMVKPNRLKINLDFGTDKIVPADGLITGNLKVNWLHGAPGKNLKAEFDVLLTRATTQFDAYQDYVFDDPSIDFVSESINIFDGTTDSEGQAVVDVDLNVSEAAPGSLNAVFRGKVYEESGNFSIDRFSIPFYPYKAITGVRLPVGDKARGMLLTDTTHRVDIVTVDEKGNPLSGNVDVTLYKIQWRWWWDASEGAVNYMSGNNQREIAKSTIKTQNGKGTWTFKIKYPEWGRYFIRAVSRESGHSAGKVLYLDWPGWAGRARKEGEGATMLSFSSDKPQYNIGEKATLVIPGSDNGRALISIENGSRVLETYWLETKNGDNPFSFTIKSGMTPNIFAHVTLLQPHAQKANDLPIRLYGVIPLQVEDPATHLNPVLSMPDVLEPAQEVTIKVSEKEGRKMTYTVAIVDEGLLDLTRFKTPDAWSRFYAREALGVKTWDIYDDVMGAFGGGLDRLLALGGDGDIISKEDDSKSNRFKPVVKVFGPFTQEGGTSEHRFIMPMYIGSVKTMLVAGNDGAYGSAEKATPVRKPLMALATLPRVLGPEERVKLPITLFRSDKNIQQVKVDVSVSGPLGMDGPSTQTVTMNDSDLTFDFALLVKAETGIAKIQIKATSGNFSATDDISVEVRNPNPPITRVADHVLDAGKSWELAISPIGIAGSNTAMLEVSSLPPVNLGQRLQYLIRYPYGCIEQTTSAVFPQLYLEKIKPMTEDDKTTVQSNVRAGIERLKSFMNADGGYAYWPGAHDADSWSTSYAGHFLIEAEARGYYIPNDMMRRWKKYQKSRAQAWRRNSESGSSELIQAYRLYTLAMANDADMGSMNRLREQGKLPLTAAWMLASAYVKAGQPEAARTIMANLPVRVKAYQEMAYSYGSEIRDEAIILETLLLLNDRTRAFELVKKLSSSLSNPNSWMSTQTLAWGLKSIAQFAGGEKGELKFAYIHNGKQTEAATGLTFVQVPLPMDGLKGSTLKLNSQSKGILFARIVQQGIPSRGEEVDESENLNISVSYTDKEGSTLDPSSLEQGTSFVATVTVSHPGSRGVYKNLALNQIFPSGWEISNFRLTGDEDSNLTRDIPTYQDIRDDRVYTYFDLTPGQRKSFKVMLTASFAGSYYLPATNCEAMYDAGVYARKRGQAVTVNKRATP